MKEERETLGPRVFRKMLVLLTLFEIIFQTWLRIARISSFSDREKFA